MAKQTIALAILFMRNGQFRLNCHGMTIFMPLSRNQSLSQSLHNLRNPQAILEKGKRDDSG